MPNKSISFNEEMIKAILDGRKTKTRRPHAEPKYRAGDVVRISNTGFYLQITSMRKEKLQDITEQDAIAEGVKAYPCDHARRSCSEIGCYGPTAKATFIDLWNSIYGNDESKQWQANPWVWVYEFERV